MRATPTAEEALDYLVTGLGLAGDYAFEFLDGEDDTSALVGVAPRGRPLFFGNGFSVGLLINSITTISLFLIHSLKVLKSVIVCIAFMAVFILSSVPSFEFFPFLMKKSRLL